MRQATYTPNGATFASNPQNAANQAMAGAISSVCSGRSFADPQVLTLVGASNAAIQIIKMQSPDDVVESVMGSQGVVSFTVSQMPDRAGLALGGAALLGIDALRKRLQTFALIVGQLNYDGAGAAQLTNPINIRTANVDGNTGAQVLSADQFANNMQQNAGLITLTTPFILHSNTLITMTKNALTAISLTLSNLRFVPYNSPYNF